MNSDLNCHIVSLRMLFDQDALEACIYHRAAEYMKELILLGDDILVSKELLSDKLFTADMLAVIGKVCSKEKYFELVVSYFDNDSLNVRDAVVSVLENWGGEDSIKVLSSHNDRVDWIQDYIERVLISLKNVNKENSFCAKKH
jgi:hypothetical protein